MQLFQLKLDQVPSLMDEMNTVNIDESSQFMIKSTYLCTYLGYVAIASLEQDLMCVDTYLGRYGCSLGLGIFGFGFIAMYIVHTCILCFIEIPPRHRCADVGGHWPSVADAC